MDRKFKSFKKKILPRVISDPDEREKFIKNDFPARFEIKRNENINEKIDIIDRVWNLDKAGKSAVIKHNKAILKYAEKHNLDPDITRSVMFAENARGHKLGANKLADKNKTSDSPLPMNIQKDRWSSLVDKEPDDLYDEEVNIEAGTVLLKRIVDRIDQPDAAKVGSIWQYVGREKTNDFGEYIGKIYDEKPWKEID